MRKIFVIGIGVGDPDHVTIQAINALNQVDVFFVANKGADKADLNRLRREICDRFIKDRTYRMVEFQPASRNTPCGRPGCSPGTSPPRWTVARPGRSSTAPWG